MRPIWKNGILVDADNNDAVIAVEGKPEEQTIDVKKVFSDYLKSEYSLEVDSLQNTANLATKVRTEEKTKLYNQLEEGKNKAIDLEKEKNTLLGQLEELKKKPVEKSKSDETELSGKITELTSIIAKQKEDSTKLFTDLQADFAEVRRKDGLTALKNQLVAEAGGALIPELVFGNTPEEIQLSVESSKQRYAEIVGNTIKNTEEKAKADAEAKAKADGESTPLTTKTIVNNGANVQVSAVDVANMSMEEYAKHRDSLFGA